MLGFPSTILDSVLRPMGRCIGPLYSRSTAYIPQSYGVGPSATLISSARPNAPSRVKSVIGVNGAPLLRYDVGSPRSKAANTPATILPPTGPSLIGMSSGYTPESALSQDDTCASD